MRGLSTILITLVMILAGCTDDGGTDQGTPATGDDDSSTFVHNITLAMGSAQINETFEGAFQPSENPPLPTATGSGGVQNHDISSLLSDREPQFVRVEVEPDDGRFKLAMTSDDPGSIWTAQRSATSVEAAVVPARGSTTTVSVSYSGSSIASASGDADGADYAVHVSVERDPRTIPSGIALGVTMPAAGTTVAFEGVGGDVPPVLAFGPDDTFLGTISAGAQVDTTLGPNGTTGEYVFVPQGHGSFFRLTVTTSAPEPPPVRILTQAITPGDTKEATNGEANDWTFSVDRRPLQVAACAISPNAVVDPMIEIETPGGSTLAASGQGPWLGGFGVCVFSDMGDPQLTAGDYTLRYEDDGGESTTVQEFVVHYGR